MTYLETYQPLGENEKLVAGMFLQTSSKPHLFVGISDVLKGMPNPIYLTDF